jgi:hypothetical protein
MHTAATPNPNASAGTIRRALSNTAAAAVAVASTLAAFMSGAGPAVAPEAGRLNNKAGAGHPAWLQEE